MNFHFEIATDDCMGFRDNPLQENSEIHTSRRPDERQSVTAKESIELPINTNYIHYLST